MLTEDRVTLRNLALAVSASTVVAVLIGTTCLGRAPRGQEPEPVSTTRVMSADEPLASEGALDISAQRAPPSPAPASRAEPAEARPEPAVAQERRPAEPAASAPIAAATTPQPAPEVVDAAVPTPAPPATPPPPPPPPLPPRLVPRTPTEGLEAGAGGFLTEPPPFSASNLAPNPEAGAGPFVTEHVTPVIVP
jgi:hypothetical protein